MAEHAKLTLSLMRAGVPNMEILGATDLPALVKVAQKHGLQSLLSEEQSKEEQTGSEALHWEEASAESPSQRAPAGPQPPASARLGTRA